MNREQKMREYRRAYKQRHPDRIKESKERWRKKNMERSAAYSRATRQRYLEQYRLKDRLWGKNHPESVAQKRRRRRAILKSVPTEKYTTREIYIRDSGICSICEMAIELHHPARHPLSLSVHHTTPLSKGGTDLMDNVTIAHYSCNSRVGNRQ